MQKTLMWVGIGLGVIIVEVGISYLLITQFANKKPASAIEAVEVLVIEDAEQPAEEKESDPAEEKESDPTEEKESDPAVKVTDDDFDPEAVYTLADFVVNPAFSEGKHFFVSSMVFAFSDPENAERLTRREPLLQDRILDQLGKRTFTFFGDYNNRDALKEELAQIACDVLGINGGVKVYFSKYVLQ
ncbi:flagellar basal body-associated FliL family protein [bacterium]|nr:flagellar basal body-associated FliL family protein [bacterium]